MQKTAVEEALQKLGDNGNTKYCLTIKNEMRDKNTTVYNIEIQGIKELNQIDDMKDKVNKLFKDWHIQTKETISFIGSIKGDLNKQQKEMYKNQLFKSLQGKYTTSYQDDYNIGTIAYYGYTPFVEEYTKTSNGTKVNVQITFIYNEVQDTTQVIIAFPFYNAPY